MNMNSTTEQPDRGNEWDYVTINDCLFRFRMDPEYGFEAQEDNGGGEWFDCYETWHFLQLLHTERQQHRADLESALSELCNRIAARCGLAIRGNLKMILDHDATRDELAAICGEVMAMDGTPPATLDSERVAGLVKRFRCQESAKWTDNDYTNGIAAGYGFAADELEAALAACATGVKS
jgi:hypothetical protein